jgi:hypothetical protein
MNSQYGKEERVFMAISYENSQSYTAVKRAYHAKFGYQKTPSFRTVKRVHDNLINKGSILNNNKGKCTCISNVNIPEKIELIVQNRSQWSKKNRTSSGKYSTSQVLHGSHFDQ